MAFTTTFDSREISHGFDAPGLLMARRQFRVLIFILASFAAANAVLLLI